MLPQKVSTCLVPRNKWSISWGRFFFKSMDRKVLLSCTAAGESCDDCSKSQIRGRQGSVTVHYTYPILHKSTVSQTFSDGCLGSHNDEGRSELRYAVWIAEFSESLDCWTQKAPSGFLLGGTSVSVFLCCHKVGSLAQPYWEGWVDPG